MKQLKAISLMAIVGSACSYDPQTLEREAISSYCHLAAECCSAADASEITVINVPYYSLGKEQCIERQSESGSPSELALLQESLSAGRISWDGFKAAECYRPSFDAANSCDLNEYVKITSSRDEEECGLYSFVTGKVPDGDPCVANWECATEGAYCDRPEDDGEGPIVITAFGNCKAPLSAGEECGSGEAECAPGTYCNGVCTRLASAGESCENTPCSQDLYCSLAAVCADKKADGATCEWSEECLSSWCDSGLCSSDFDGGEEREVIYEVCQG